MNVRSQATVWLLAPLLVLAAAGCSKSPPAAPPAAQTGPSVSDQWTTFVDRYIEESFVANPFFAVDQGRHDFDGRAPDFSAAGLAKEIARQKAARDEAQKFATDGLTPAQQFEREYLLRGVISKQLFWLDTARAPFKNPTWYLDRIDPDPILSREYAPLEKRIVSYTGYAKAIPQIAAAVRANLQTPLPKTYVERGIAGFGGFASFYRSDVPKVFASVTDPELQKQFAEANEAAAKAMDEVKDWLVAQRKTATDDFALGPELFSQMLEQTEGVKISLDELRAAGQADLERNLAAVREACAKYLPKGTVQACFAKMQKDKPKDGTVQTATAQLDELRKYVADKHIVTIPSAEQAKVKEAPPYNAANFAYINVPGPYESKGVAWTYFVAPPDPSWTAKERAEYIPGKADLLFTSVHEVWPGHFLQFQHAVINPSKVAGMWVGYAYAEGWAHYAEEMMWEAGLGEGDPETHIGQISNALLRNVRFLSAIGLHTGGMTVAQSEKLFRDSAFSDIGTARQQAARGTYDPAYLNYTLGKLMIRKLRTDWMAAHPADAAIADSPQKWQAFHDKFLSYGGPPIPLVRSEMMKGVPGGEGTLF
jgi:uncharacterized protein (DUF885 family)